MLSTSQNTLCTNHASKAFFTDSSLVDERDKQKTSKYLKSTSLADSKTFKSNYFSEEQKARFNLLKEDKFLNKRFITHLFGDSFMQNTIYEGWFVSDALMHMIAILKDNQVTPEISQVLKDLESCLNWHNKVFSNIEPYEPDDVNEPEEVENEDNIEEPLEVEDSSAPQEAKESHKLVEEMKEAIKNLTIGEKLLFPGGCLQHSVLYEIKCIGEDDFMVGVYNSGMGAIKHMQFIENEGDHKIVGVYRLHHIKLEKIVNTSFIVDLLELNQSQPARFTSRLYDEILPALEGKKDSLATDPSEYMLKQRSGICVWKMLSAYCRYNLPLIQRKYLKLKARLDVFQKWYDLGYPLNCLKISQNLLEKLIVNHKFEIYGERGAPTNFSREELLAMGIYKAKKTFNKYKMLLNSEEIQKAETWYTKFTGQSIYEV